MSFWELLKIEFKKVKRGKIVPLIFVAPLLVVVSGVANLQSYFTPEYTNDRLNLSIRRRIFLRFITTGGSM